MKKFISMMCLLLTFATLFCACNGEEPIETQPVTESVTTTEKQTEETTKAPAPTKNTAFIDVDGTLSATSKELTFMRLKEFENGEYLHSYVQGGVIVGDYAYSCMVTPWNQTAFKDVFRTCIVKRSLINGEIVAKSESLPMGSSNDATYVPDDNTIVVCDGAVNGNNIVHIVDADTLELKKSISLKGGAQSIAYDTVNKRYIGYKYNDGTGKNDLYIYNKDFQILKIMSGFEKMDSQYEGVKFNWQGMHTDGTYLYILEWHGGSKYASGATIEKEVETKLRIIELSTGKMVDRIDLGFQREPEYIGFRKGKFYIGTNNIRWTGMELYQVSITTEKN